MGYKLVNILWATVQQESRVKKTLSAKNTLTKLEVKCYKLCSFFELTTKYSVFGDLFTKHCVLSFFALISGNK